MHLLMILLCLFVRFRMEYLKVPYKILGVKWGEGGGVGRGREGGDLSLVLAKLLSYPPPLSHCDSFV
jgi:hypothetical protein